MRKRVLRALNRILTATMIIGLLPVNAYAYSGIQEEILESHLSYDAYFESELPVTEDLDEILPTGSEITSNSASGISDALKGAESEYDEETGTLTVNLTQDVKLNEPLILSKGNTGDTILINLNGYSIEGAAGTDYADESEEATGKTAILINAAEFNVTINGPGSVIGGKGAICEAPDEEEPQNYNGYRFGCDGGDAIFLANGDQEYDAKRLEYALTITGGAILSGGAGADVSDDDWVNNLNARKDADKRVTVWSGNGGMGIRQAYTTCNPTEREYYGKLNSVYLKYIIDDGAVIGGAGGNADAGNRLFSKYEIVNDPVVKSVSSIWYDEESYFDGAFFDRIGLHPGDGGNGITYFSGRKYIYVGEKGLISGGDGGDLFCIEAAKTAFRIGEGGRNGAKTGDGGVGILCCGDSGLTNTEPKLSISTGEEGYDGDKTKDSNDIGIWIDGMVSGGSSPDNDIRLGSTGSGGYGIKMDGWESFSYTWFSETYGWVYDNGWGIIAVGENGTVSGGAGGNAVWGDGGYGGDAIIEAERDLGRSAECPNYLIRGSVKGGKGGNSLCGADDINAHSSSFSKSLSEFGGPGVGGNGIRFMERGRKGVVIAGDGSINGGDGGSCSRRSEDEEYTEGEDAIYVTDPDYSVVDADLTLVKGEPMTVLPMNSTGLSAVASMDPFTWSYEDGYANISLSDDTEVKLQVNLPEGYDGTVYYDWRVTFQNVSDETYNYTYGDRYEYDVGSEVPSFKLGESLLTSDKLIEYGSLQGNGGKMRTSIYCYVMLEDGRFVKSSPVTFLNDGKGYGGGGNVPVPGPVPVTGIYVTSPVGNVINKGQTVELTAIVIPADASSKEVSWSSSNEEVATVDDNGKVTALKDGTVTIKATSEYYPMVEGTIKLTVKTRVTSLELTAPADSGGRLQTGKSFALTATFNEGASDRGLTWVSADPTVADVDQGGKVTGKTAGETTITASSTEDPSVTDSCDITVFEPVTGIKFNASKISIGKGESYKLRASVTPATAAGAEIEYTSSDDTVVTIVTDGSGNVIKDEDGFITVKGGMFDGTGKSATITAKAQDGSGKTAVCTVTVGNSVRKFEITAPKGQDTLVVGKTLQLSVRFNGGNKNDQPVNKEVTWSVESVKNMDGDAVEDEGERPYYATVDAKKGTIKGKAACTVTVKAVHVASGNSDTYDVRMFVPMKKLALKESKVTITEDKAGGYQLGATVTPSNATLFDKDNKIDLAKDKLVWEVTRSDKAADGTSNIVDVDASTGHITVKKLPAGSTKATATVKVTAKSDGEDGGEITKTATCTITVVKSVMANKVVLDKTKLNAGVGSSYKLKATVLPASADDASIVWSCDVEDGVVSLADEGSGTAAITVKAVPQNKKHQAVITATNTASGKSAKCTITVGNAVSAVTIAKTGDPKRLITGKTLRLKASVACAESATNRKAKAANTSVVWKITKVLDADGTELPADKYSRIATIDNKGKVKANGCGTVTVTATSNEKPNGGEALHDSVEIVTYIPINKFAISASKRTVGEGNTGFLWVTSVTPATACDPADTDQSINWTSSNPAAIMVAAYNDGDDLSGLEFDAAATTKKGQRLIYKAIAPSKKAVTITAATTDGSKKSVKCTVTVLGRMKKADVKLKITGKSAKSLKGKIKVTAKENEGDDGKVPGYDTAAKILFVENLPVNKSVTLTPVLTATAYNKTVTYESSNPDVATVTKKGVITAKRPGTATVKMKTADGGYTAECTVTIP